MKKVAFHTLGCRANQYQTDLLKTEHGGQGARVVPFTDKADIYVINTCTVTVDADRTSIRLIRKAFRQNPQAKVIVTGCYARLEADKLKQLFHQIEIIDSPSLPIPQHPPKSVKIRQNLMVQNGCENFCTYCVVPYARGPINSKPIDQVLTEAEQLVQAGAREIVLTGINLGTYQFDLSSLVPRLSSLDKLLRLRLSSIEPMYLTKELIDTMAKTPKVCQHLHVPLQSGDDQILKRMNRNYTVKDYSKLINYARKVMPDCAITTDIIVGFPGETEKAFQNTLDLVKQIKFSRIHIFSYSKRPGTPAADYPDQVDPAAKKKRNKRLHQLRDKHMKAFAEQYLNKEVEILVENNGVGLTSNFIRCLFNDPTDPSGQLKMIFARSVNNSGEIRE